MHLSSRNGQFSRRRSGGTITIAGYAATFGGLISLLGPLAWVGTSLAVAGAAIAAVNLVLDRMDALERNWITERLVDLNRFADRLEQEIARR